MSPSVLAPTRLPGGMTLLVEPVAGASSVAIGGWLRCGTRHERADQAGMAHFLEHMVFKGSSHHTARQLARALEALGGRVDAYTCHEHTGYTLQVLPTKLGRAVGLLSELIVKPSLAPTDVETEKKVILEEIAEAADNPLDRAGELAVQAAWGDHPLAQPVLGTRHSIQRFSAAQVRAHHRIFYRTDRMLLAAAGAVSDEDLLPLLDQSFSAMPSGSVPDEIEPPRFRPGLASQRRDLDQIHLCLLYPGLAATDPDREALWLLDVILGATTSSELFQRVREERGLAYHVASAPQAHHDGGLMSIEAIVGTRQVAEALTVIRGCIEQILADGVDLDTLAWSRDYARATLLLSVESMGSRLGRLARNWLAEERVVPVEETIRALDRLEPEDISRVARRIFRPGEVVLSVVGPVTDKRRETWWNAVAQ